MEKKNKKQIIKKEVTPIIAKYLEIWLSLEESKDSIIKGGFLKKISIEDKIIYIKEIGRINALLWMEIYKEYPELKEFDDLTVNAKYIYTKLK